MEQIDSTGPVVKKMSKAEKKLAKHQRMLERILEKRREAASSDGKKNNDTISLSPEGEFAGEQTEDEALTEAELVAIKRQMVEDRMRAFIDELSNTRRSPRHSTCLEMLVEGFAGTVCSQFLLGNAHILSEIISRSLKSGDSEAQLYAASLAAIVVIQCGATPAGAEIQRKIRKILLSNIVDESVAAEVREKFAAALGVTTYIGEEDIQATWDVMEKLASVFSRSCGPLGELKLPIIPAPEAKVHRAALLSWGLLLLVAEERASDFIDRNLGAVTALLQSADVDTRVVAGEVLALMYEIGRKEDSDFEGDDAEQLCADLHSLAIDSRKYRAKRERRIQRASFRQFERAVRDGNEPKIRVLFGIETLMIRTWAHKRIYDSTCIFLQDGMNVHLNSNSVLRDLLGLGDPITLRLKKCKGPRPVPSDVKSRTKEMTERRRKRMDFVEP